jgi:RHS repeat-associated protein
VSTRGVQFGYDSKNKRVWTATVDGQGQLTAQRAYFYGVDGTMLGVYTLTLGGSLTASPSYLAVYFRSKRVAVGPNGITFSAFNQDRLGSQGTYYPYGEDTGTPLGNDQFKFATYWRDSATGLDYANQRYYVNNFGRFMTPDPYLVCTFLSARNA